MLGKVTDDLLKEVYEEVSKPESQEKILSILNVVFKYSKIALYPYFVSVIILLLIIIILLIVLIKKL